MMIMIIIVVVAVVVKIMIIMMVIIMLMIMVYWGRISVENVTCSHAELEAADGTSCITQPQCVGTVVNWGRYHGGRRPSSNDSLHSPTVIPPSALDKPSIMKRYHRRPTCSHTSSRRSPMMVTLHDTRFVECRWWNDGWTVKTVVT